MAAASQEPASDPRQMMLAKDECARSLQSSLEAERRQRRQLQAEAAVERTALQERFRQVEGDLQQQLQVQHADMEERREEHLAEVGRSSEQLRIARSREADLLGKNSNLADDLRRLVGHSEADAGELLALRAKVDALTADLAEAHGGLRLSDEVRCGLIREAKEKDSTLEQLRLELRELHLVERSGREQAQAQYERLNAQCESMTRQAQDRGREALVLEERCQRLEENLRVKGLEHDRFLGEAEERRHQVEARLTRVEEEAGILRDELRTKSLAESKLKEAIAAHEALIEDHKREEQRLRQELFRLQATCDEKDLALHAGEDRERLLQTMQSTLEERLHTTTKDSEDRQTALFAARDKCQTLELELQGARDITTAVREELSRTRSAAEAQRLEDTQRMEEKLAQRESEIRLLQGQVSERQKELCGNRSELDKGNVDAAKVRGELAVSIASRESEVKSRDDAAARAQVELVAARDARDEMEVVLARVRRELESSRAEASRTQMTLNAAQTAAEANQAKMEALEEKIMAWRPTVLTEEGVQTSPRILPAASPWYREGQVWGGEMAALHRSVESLQAMVNVGALPETVFLPGPASTREVAHVSDIRSHSSEQLCIYMERHLHRLHRQCRLTQAWESWSSHMHAAGLRAEFDMHVADDYRLVRECDARGQVSPPLPTSKLDELTVATLKRLLLEFRLRLVAAVSDMSPSTSAESRASLVENLDSGRRCFGRIFHAALFLYQKLRAFVPSELQESLQDPLSKLVPFPFYVLPYKAQHSLRQGLTALAHGAPTRARSASPPQVGKASAPGHGGAETREEWFSKRISEMEQRLPLASSSKVEVPHFLTRLLQCRAMAIEGGGNVEEDKEEAPWRDRFDVLLVDALTVYMSAWRTAGSAETTPQANMKPYATSSPYLSAPTQPHVSQLKLRLGAKVRSGM